MSKDQLLLLRTSLVMDQSNDIRGRVLKRDIPGTNLKKGDRLEASPSFPDIWANLSLISTGTKLTFFRTSKVRYNVDSKIIEHCSLLFNEIVSPDNCLM